MAAAPVINLSPGLKEILRKYCEDENLLSLACAVLQEEQVVQVLSFSTLSDADVSSIRKKIIAKDDSFKGKEILINTCLKSAVRDANFQADLAQATDKIVAQKDASSNQRAAAVSKMHERIEALKKAMGVKDMRANILPPISVWRKLLVALPTYVDFNTDLRNTDYAGSILPVHADPVGIFLQASDDQLPTVVQQVVPKDIADRRSREMSGTAWAACFIRYSTALLLADIEQGEGAKLSANIDVFTLWSYMMSVNVLAAKYGWSLAYDVDCAFRRLVEARCLEGAVPLREAISDTASFAQITVDKTLYGRHPSHAPAKSGADAKGESATHSKKDSKSGAKRSRANRSSGKLCYEFLATGSCKRPNCHFRHEDAAGTPAEKRPKAGPKKFIPDRLDTRDVWPHVSALVADALARAEEEWQKESSDLTDGTGIFGSLDTNFYAPSSPLLERLARTLDLEVEELLSSETGEALASWLNLSRQQQSTSSAWSDHLPVLSACADRIRIEWARLLEVNPRPAECGSPVRPLLMQAIIAELGNAVGDGCNFDLHFLDLVDKGLPLGTSGEVPRSGVWPAREYDVRDRFFPISKDLWRENYRSTADYETEVQAAISKEIALGRMSVVEPNEIHKIKAITRLGCVPSFDAEGNVKKIRVVDDLTESGCNTLIRSNVSETILLPNISAACRIAVMCKVADVGGADPLYWVESDVKSAFRQLRLSDVDSWFCCNRVGERIVRHLALPFGAVSSPLLFCRLSGLDSIIATVMLCLCSLFHRLVTYIDDRGIPVKLRFALKVALVSVLVDLICGIEPAFEKLFVSQQPHCLGFVLNLVEMTLTLSAEKLQVFTASLGGVSNQGDSVAVKDLEKLVGRLAWVSVPFKKLRPFLMPFYASLHIGKSKSLRSIKVGKALASAATFLRRFFQTEAAIPMHSLLPDMGDMHRTVLVSDACTKKIGGYVLHQFGESGNRILWYQADVTDRELSALLDKLLERENASSAIGSPEMCLLELLALVVGAAQAPRSNLVVAVTDNEACSHVIKSMRSRSTALSKLMQSLMVIRPHLAGRNLTAVHVAGEKNVLADWISRSTASEVRHRMAGVQDCEEVDIRATLHEFNESL
ncbi:hypothetical protein FOL47_000717 [Perkinsus chesapeaki]|uniref:C3H1-type domain-containing protein n=1 Tax=Perkinsus chesapeaki TaxID=330153 RepID=A0A7J6ML37_PERCH|nr:hypothetical protein FOL47_000717 [Perkinsus chesapeaki]